MTGISSHAVCDWTSQFLIDGWTETHIEVYRQMSSEPSLVGTGMLKLDQFLKHAIHPTFEIRPICDTYNTDLI